jgi:hypothetical protein
MEQEVDKNKLKELKNIIILVLIDKEKYNSNLIKFEQEIPAGIYYTEIILESVSSDELMILEYHKVIELILERVEFINFHDKEEIYIRKLIKNSKHKNVQAFLTHYLQHNPKKTFLFPIMIDEVSKLTNEIDSYIERMLEYVDLMSFKFNDSNILKFHSETIKLISERLDESGYRFFELIFFKGNPFEYEERFHLLYPDLKLILLESSITEGFLNLLSDIFDFIPSKDSLKIFDKLLDEFRQPSSRNQISLFFSVIFEEFDENFQDYCYQYL